MKSPVSLRKKIESDGTRLSHERRVPSVSIFSLTKTERFYNFSQLGTLNHNQFHFLRQKTEIIQTVSRETSFFYKNTLKLVYLRKKILKKVKLGKKKLSSLMKLDQFEKKKKSENNF